MQGFLWQYEENKFACFINLLLIVLLFLAVKPSKPRCWMDGKLLEGSDVKLSCKSSDGSDPISYKWERVLDKGKSLGKLPTLALIGKESNWHFSDMLIQHPALCREML